MIFRKFPAFLAAAAMLLTLCPALLQAEVFGDFEYSVNNESVTITGYRGPKDVVIPPTIEGKPVTVIGDQAFHSRYEIISVAIPPSETRRTAGVQSWKR